MCPPDLRDFLTVARSFCALAEQDIPDTQDETDLWRIRELLLQLMHHIPAVDAAPRFGAGEIVKTDDASYARAVSRFSGFVFNLHRAVFDPHDLESEEPTLALLSDHLADIYRDLSNGLGHADQGNIEAACLAWSFSYQVHWGRHAVSAFMAIELYRINEYKDVIIDKESTPKL